jgi:formylglycine-generating enzyme
MATVLARAVRRPLLAALSTLVLAASASAAVFEWSSVGYPGNAPDPATGSVYGAVPYVFSIGTHDVTVGQYVEFLNAKDPRGTNTLRLYAAGMSGVVQGQGLSYGGIDFSAANADGAKYSAKAGQARRPVTFVSFHSAMRFANWVHHGQGQGDTETGAYALGPLDANAAPIEPRITRSAGARVWIPNENEWYKAAYHGNPDASSSGYFSYPTSSSKAPTGSAPGPLPNQVNAWPLGGGTGLPDNVTDVGAYAGTTSPYGAFDMGGNVFQWVETVIEPTAFYPLGRGIRGGSFAGSTDDMRSSTRFSAVANADHFRNLGFRLASFEPGVVAPTLPKPGAVGNSIAVKTAGGKGTIGSAGGPISCGKTCAAVVSAGTQVSLTAVAEPGFRFVNWTGACTGPSATCIVQVFGKLQAQANFTK